MIFMTVTLSLFGLLFLFMGVIAPRGDYRKFPGINTPTTTASKGAWQAAHRTVSTINVFIAIYFFGSLGALWLASFQITERTFIAIVLVGLLMFVPVILVGNRAAQQFLDGEGR